MAETEDRWVARLAPTPSTSVNALLAMPMGLDIWERHHDALVVAASESQLLELERRQLARVERLSTVSEFEARARRQPGSGEGGRAG